MLKKVKSVWPVKSGTKKLAFQIWDPKAHTIIFECLKPLQAGSLLTCQIYLKSVTIYYNKFDENIARHLISKHLQVCNSRGETALYEVCVKQH
jgi:hypothetical protein